MKNSNNCSSSCTTCCATSVNNCVDTCTTDLVNTLQHACTVAPQLTAKIQAEIVATFEAARMIHPETIEDMIQKVEAEAELVKVAATKATQHEIKQELHSILSEAELQQYQQLAA